MLWGKQEEWGKKYGGGGERHSTLVLGPWPSAFIILGILSETLAFDTSVPVVVTTPHIMASKPNAA